MYFSTKSYLKNNRYHTANLCCNRMIKPFVLSKKQKRKSKAKKNNL
jgi:hypothetical protein